VTARGGDILAWLDRAITEREWIAQGAARNRGARWVRPVDTAKVRISAADLSFPVLSQDIAEHIIYNSPESVLRRCAADRKLLELHRPMDHEGEMAVFCSECDVSGDYPYFPCQTLRILAEGYGWSEQTSLATDQGQTPPIEGDQVT
jgi:hypothetical protein